MEQPPGDATLWLPADSVDDSAVEALDQTIGLGPVRSGEAMLDAAFGAEAVKWVTAGWLVLWLVLHIDGEAIGKLGTIVREDGVYRIREVRQEAGRGLGIPPGMDLKVDVTGGAIDGDVGIAFTPLQRRQMLEINMDEPDSGLLEDADSRLVRFRTLAEAVALETAMGSAAREPVVDAAPHHLDDIIERQLQLGSQLADQRLLRRREAGLQPVGDMRMVVRGGAATPTTDRGFADTEFSCQLRNRPLAALNVSSDLRGGGGVSVEIQFHDARRSLT